MKPTEIEVTIHLDDDTSVTITADGKRPAEVIARVLGAFTETDAIDIPGPFTRADAEAIRAKLAGGAS